MTKSQKDQNIMSDRMGLDWQGVFNPNHHQRLSLQALHKLAFLPYTSTEITCLVPSVMTHWVLLQAEVKNCKVAEPVFWLRKQMQKNLEKSVCSLPWPDLNLKKQ